MALCCGMEEDAVDWRGSTRGATGGGAVATVALALGCVDVVVETPAVLLDDSPMFLLTGLTAACVLSSAAVVGEAELLADVLPFDCAS